MVSEVKIGVYSWRYLAVSAICTYNSQIYGILEDRFISSFEPRRVNAKTLGASAFATRLPAFLVQR